jgi:2-polyprenyl-3-methyl-5-hydroxy-6-metoxy-1,4-benzoquinol methylase
MEDVVCEICGSAEYGVLLDKLWLCEKYNWKKEGRILFSDGIPVNYRNVCCKQCGLVYINPRMTDGETVEFYKKQYRKLYTANIRDNKQNNNFPFTAEHLGIEIYNAVVRYDFLKRLGYLKKEITTLDIGSSLGALPAYLKNKGCNAYGVELSQFADYTNELFGVDTIFRVPFEDLKTDIKFDMVTICDALEHFSHPKNVLLKIRDLLKDDGIVLIEVPDIFKPHKTLLGFFSNAHLFTFSPNSIKNLLNISGFEILYFEYGGYCMNMRVVAKKGVMKDLEAIDDFNFVIDFIARYDKVYDAMMQFKQNKISYESALNIVRKTIPGYNVINFIQAVRLYESGNVNKAKELLIECILSDFNEEDLTFQKGNIYGLLAIICFNTGDMVYARFFLKQAFELLPKLYEFPYLEGLANKGVFNIKEFVMRRGLYYEELFKMKRILKNYEKKT